LHAHFIGGFLLLTIAMMLKGKTALQNRPASNTVRQEIFVALNFRGLVKSS